jgi:exopolyphosphatase/pppGpp-phosphohydrolase
MSTIEEIKLPSQKIADSLNSAHEFDALYPENQARAEAAELKSDFTKASKKQGPQIKMYDIEESDIYKGLAIGSTNGYKKKEIPMQKTTSWNGKMEMSAEKIKGITIDYETINREKRRFTSGYRDLATEEQFLTLPSFNKMNLAGFREPYLIYPAPEVLYGNIPYQDSNAVAGYDRKFASFQAQPYFGTNLSLNM